MATGTLLSASPWKHQIGTRVSRAASFAVSPLSSPNSTKPQIGTTAAKRFGVPVIAIAGTLQPGAEVLIDNGVDAFFAIVDRPMSLEEAMSQALPLLEKAGERMMRLVRIRLDEG